MVKKCSFCGKDIDGLLPTYWKLKNGYLGQACNNKYHIVSHVNPNIMNKWLETITVADCKKLINNPDQLKQAKIDHGYTKLPFESVAHAKKREEQTLKNAAIKDKRNAERQAKIAKQEAESKKAKAEYEKLLPIFKKERSASFPHFIFDDKRQQVLQKKSFLVDPRVINYSDIISYRVNEYGHNDKKHHGITRAIVGGALAGGAGAVVGALTGGKQTDYIDHLGLVVSLKDGTNFEVVFIRKIEQCKSNSFNARESVENMNRLISILDGIIAKNKPAQNAKPVESKQSAKTIDPADEIAKYKKLLDAKAITQEEYDKKKKELLNL